MMKLSAFCCLAMLIGLSGCGNKGDLFIEADEQTTESLERLQQELDEETLDDEKKKKTNQNDSNSLVNDPS